MAATVHCISSCWGGLPSQFSSLSLNTNTTFRPLSFSSATYLNLFTKGGASVRPLQMPVRRSIVCEATPAKKADSAAKRARQAEKRRIYNKARKSEIRTRMKKVLEELEVLRKL